LNSVIPWYQHLIYKGINLEGAWYLQTESQKILLEIKQNSESITGKATAHALNQKKDHFDDLKTFDVKGSINERFLLLTLLHTDTKRIGIVTQLLQIEGDGTLMKGTGSWYAPRKSKIVSGDVEYYRNEISAKDECEKKANKSE